MTRRPKPPTRKKPAGVLRGMRSGVQKVAGVAGEDDREGPPGAVAPKKPASNVWNVVGNVISAVLILVAIAVFLRRCGIVKF